MALVVRIKPRAERQIDGAAAWGSENRPAALGAIHLVINLTTARALGLKIPPSALLRADRVIE